MHMQTHRPVLIFVGTVFYGQNPNFYNDNFNLHLALTLTIGNIGKIFGIF